VVCLTTYIYIYIHFINYFIDTIHISPLPFWKDHQHQYPVLATLAQDVLSIPATGAGVERLFNTARDICHYRRGRLNATTIQELMMFLCASKFDMEEEQFTFLKDFFSRDEIEASKEERDFTLHQVELDPISDNEDEDQEGEEEVSDDEDEDEVHALPTSEEANTQIRASVRARKRLRREDDQFVYH
jgi:hypothetical protein